MKGKLWHASYPARAPCEPAFRREQNPSFLVGFMLQPARDTDHSRTCDLTHLQKARELENERHRVFNAKRSAGT